jgi:hypothetical protein
MRGIVAVLMCVLMFDVMICSAIAATFIKSDAGDKLVVVETTETTTELTPAQIDHEIQGIDSDLARIEESYLKQREGFLQRKYRYEEMKNSCVAMDIKPIKDDKIIAKPTKDPDGL